MAPMAVVELSMDNPSSGIPGSNFARCECMSAGDRVALCSQKEIAGSLSSEPYQISEGLVRE
jgi:hypothetical protein